MTTTKAAPAWPRSQHWRIQGFRITVLVYKSHRRQTCQTCGHRGAIHCVWADRDDRFSGGPADFCDNHRPAKGTLPDLDYHRYYSEGEFWTCERLMPNPEWPCTTCGQPSVIRRELHCDHCTDPEHYTVSTTHVLSVRADGLTERKETSIGHERHALVTTCHCSEHRDPGPVRGNGETREGTTE